LHSIETKKYAKLQLDPAYDILTNTNAVNLTIEPHDDKHVNQEQKQQRCQNGSNECKANTFMQCSIYSYPEPKDYLKIIGCAWKGLFKSKNPSRALFYPEKPHEQVEKVFSSCAKEACLDFNLIEECYEKEKKESELALMVSMYTPLDKNCILLVEINDEPVNITTSLAGEICKTFEGLGVPNPNNCRKSNFRVRQWH